MAPRLKVESQKDFFFLEYVAKNEWQEVVLAEDTLKMTKGSTLWLPEDGDDKKNATTSQITVFMF
jgi:hypothetical protein